MSKNVPGFCEMAAVLARRIPGAQYHVIVGAGHVINMEQPAVVGELLARFVGQLPSATGPVGKEGEGGMSDGPAAWPGPR